LFGLRLNAERQGGAPGALLIADELFYKTLRLFGRHFQLGSAGVIYASEIPTEKASMT
jgi:hypothetical protein